MRVAVLGPVRVRVACHDLALRGRPALLVAALGVRVGRSVPVATLAELLWARPPADASAAVHVVVSRTRSALARAVGASDARRLLRTTVDGYLLDIPESHVDAEELTQRTAAARAALADRDLPTAIAHATAAMALVRDDPLPDVTAAGLVWAEVDELAEAMRRAVEVWAEAHLADGRGDVVLPVLRRRLARWPTDERAAELAMIALHRDGLVGDAEAVFDRCREALADELGVPPGARLRECRRRLAVTTVVVGADVTAALRAAADFAANVGGYHRAIDGYRALLGSQRELTPRTRAEVLAGLGEALYHQYGSGEAELEVAAGEFLRLGAPHDAARSLSVLARARWLAGRTDEVVALLRRVAWLLEHAPHERSAAAALAHAAGLLSVSGRAADAASEARRAIRLTDRRPDPLVRAQASANLGLALVMQGELGDGARQLAAAIDLRRRHGAPPSTATLVTLADAHARMGRLRSARRLQAEAATIARSMDRDADLRWQQGERLTYLFWAGRWRDLDLAARDFAAAVGSDHHMSFASALGRARVLVMRGERKQAREQARAAHALARRTGDPGAVLASIAIRGSLEPVRGRLLPMADEALHLMTGTSLDASAGVALGVMLRAAGVRADDVLRRGLAPSPWREALLLVLDGDLRGARRRYGALSSVGDAALLR